MKKRNCVALWEEKPDLSPNKGKCEYDKACPSDTQPNKQPSVIIISGTWCAALKSHLESFMLHRQLSWANYLLNYWVKFRNSITHKRTNNSISQSKVVVMTKPQNTIRSVSTVLLIHMFSWANAVFMSAPWQRLPPSATPALWLFIFLASDNRNLFKLHNR